MPTGYLIGGSPTQAQLNYWKKQIGSTPWNKGVITDPEKRFWKYVKKTKHCWEWIGGKRHGYGAFSVDSTGRHDVASRYSYLIHKGKIPKGMDVCHSCDNRGCVNPAHLWVGTRKQNLEDMVQKGRSSKGEKCGLSKLKLEQVKEIRKIYNLGKKTQRQIAKEFSVQQSLISLIINKKIWVY